MLSITSYCSIANHSVLLNGVEWYAGEKTLSAPDFLTELYKRSQADYPKFYKMDHLAQLGFIAVELVLQGRNLADEYGSPAAGIVFCNANASLDADLRYFESVKNIPSPAQFVYTLPNIVIGEISIRHRLKGENAFFVQEEFDAGLLEFYVTDLFNRQRVKACLCGWVEYLQGSYKAVIYLVENKPGNRYLQFDIKNIHQIYDTANGEING